MSRLPRGPSLAQRLAAWCVVALGRLFVRFAPRRTKLRLLELAERVIERTKPEPDDPNPAAELREILESHPDEAAVIDCLLLRSPAGQLRGLLSGVLKHQRIDLLRELGIELDLRPQTPLRVAVVGSGMDADLLLAAYARRRRACSLVQVQDGPGVIDALDVVGPYPEWEGLARQFLAAGRPVGLHCALLDSAERLERLFDEAERGNGRLRLFHPALYYPPALLLRRLVQDNALGRLTNLRVRATLAGRGGALPADPPEPNAYLRHPAFDQLWLLTALGGPIERMTAYLNPLTPTGGQGLINVKFHSPGRYGLLELSYAPELHAASEYRPYDLELELTGGDGIAWLKRGMARRTSEAVLELRIGREFREIGVESGLPDEWQSAHRLAAAHLLSMAAGRDEPLLDRRAAVNALRVRALAERAAASPATLAL